jgi:hypothetical protein
MHVKSKECAEAKPNTNRCPLCHMNIRDNDKDWRNHLMGVDGCTKNARRLQALKRSEQERFVTLMSFRISAR